MSWGIRYTAEYSSRLSWFTFYPRLAIFLQSALLYPFSVSQILWDFFRFSYWLLFAGLQYHFTVRVLRCERCDSSCLTRTSIALLLKEKFSVNMSEEFEHLSFFYPKIGLSARDVIILHWGTFRNKIWGNISYKSFFLHLVWSWKSNMKVAIFKLNSRKWVYV